MTTAPTSPASRRQRRNALLLAGLAPSVCALVVALTLILMVVRNDSGRAALAAGDHDDAAARFSANRWFGTVERWVAPYNEGVASARAADLVAALNDFRAALDLAPSDRECLVLHNIAVVHEQLGDAAVDTDGSGAIDSYRQARSALASAACLGRDDAGADVTADSVVLDERVRDKILDLIATQDARDRDRLTPQEQRRAERLEEGDRRAEQRDQQQSTEPDSAPDPEPDTDYDW